jgi:hypothetical protein
MAGATAVTGVEPPAPASEERMPPCSPAAAELVARMLAGQNGELLPQACERLCRAGLRLPFALLPAAFGVRENAHRPVLAPVLGERGRWLARFNEAWSWAGDALTCDGLPADADTIWQEGTTAQRVEVLRRLRAVDPAKAREWLTDAWKRETADSRARLLATLEVGLSPTDEPFLEAALDDRSEGVRYVAPALLARLPGSALGARMRERADTMLRYTGGTLDVAPPHALDAVAQRDGIRSKPQRGMGERAWWLAQTLRLIPLAHWEERFGAPPAEIVAAAEKTEWSAALVEGWAESAALNDGAGWTFPLWLRCMAPAEPAAAYARNLRSQLARQLPRDEIEAHAAALLDHHGHGDYAERIEAVQAVPTPWSRTFAVAYLEALGRALADRKANADYTWPSTLRTMVAALPPDLLDRAAEVCTLPPDADARKHPWGYQLDAILDTIHIRQRLMEVIPL